MIVNGMFAMDSTDYSSELALADIAEATASAILVGGLGLGFTTARLLDRCPTARITVVELSQSLINWADAGLTPTLAAVAHDPRVELVHADIAQFLHPASATSTPHTSGISEWDAILLDVDNGPDFLIHDHNAHLYQPNLLTIAFHLLAPGGVLAVWSEGESSQLADHLLKLTGDSWTQIVPVSRDGRRIDYAIHCAWR